MKPDDDLAALEQACFANQLRLLARIHSLVEHHWRGLLNGITLNVALLELTLPAYETGDGETRAQVSGALAALKQAVEGYSAKITSTLAATAPQLLSEDEALDLGELLAEISNLLALETRRMGGRIALELPPERVLTEGRRGYIRQICLNLALDLLDHMPNQSTLRITVETSPGQADIIMASPAKLGSEERCSPDLPSESPVLQALAAQLGGELTHEQAPEERRHRLRIPIHWDQELPSC